MCALSSPSVGNYGVLFKNKFFKPKKIFLSLDPIAQKQELDGCIILAKKQLYDISLIWRGNLNMSHKVIVVSFEGLYNAAKVNGFIHSNEEDCGQHEITISKRKEFGGILSKGKLIPGKKISRQEGYGAWLFIVWKSNWDVQVKRMEEDYFLVLEKHKDRIIKNIPVIRSLGTRIS